MTAALARVLVLATWTIACNVGERPARYIIPGPAVPSPWPTPPPYVWDTREELAIWVDNQVARGSLALEGSGAAAFIRIDRPEREWLLRGPDLAPPARNVMTVRIRYRWMPDPTLAPGASLSIRAAAHFQSTTPVVGYDPLAQGAALVELQPQNGWTDATFRPESFKPPIEITHCYLHSFGANRGVLEIDRIELVQ